MVGGDGEDIVAGAQIACEIGDEDGHLDARERVGFKACGGCAVDPDLSAARSSEVEDRGFGCGVEMEVNAEVVWGIALGTGEVG